MEEGGLLFSSLCSCVCTYTLHPPIPPQVVIVPQCPLLAPIHTLRAQLCYPTPHPLLHAPTTTMAHLHHPHSTPASAAHTLDQRVTPAHMEQALRRVQLQHLLQRAHGNVDAHAPWLQHLSPGEVQRLAIARVLLQQPQLVVLDEATAAMSPAMERSVHSALREAGIAVLSFGQPGLLEGLHARVLELVGDGEGGWRWGKTEREGG